MAIITHGQAELDGVYEAPPLRVDAGVKVVVVQRRRVNPNHEFIEQESCFLKLAQHISQIPEFSLSS
jgi:hypothetical protein